MYPCWEGVESLTDWSTSLWQFLEDKGALLLEQGKKSGFAGDTMVRYSTWSLLVFRSPVFHYYKQMHNKMHSAAFVTPRRFAVSPLLDEDLGSKVVDLNFWQFLPDGPDLCSYPQCKGATFAVLLECQILWCENLFSDEWQRHLYVLNCYLIMIILSLSGIYFFWKLSVRIFCLLLYWTVWLCYWVVTVQVFINVYRLYKGYSSWYFQAWIHCTLIK
jgi:hypothetical protein